MVLAEQLGEVGEAPVGADDPCRIRRMNELTHLAGVWRNPTGADDLDELSLRLAQVPCSPLYERHISPDRELTALLTDARA